MWSNEFLIGNAIIDKQHKKLFAVGSDLLKNYWNKNEVDKETLTTTLGFFKDYTVNHFADEERLQVALKYKGYEEHKRQHENLINQVLLREKALIESSFAKKELDSFISILITWLTHHVAVEDKKIAKKKFLWFF